MSISFDDEPHDQDDRAAAPELAARRKQQADAPPPRTLPLLPSLTRMSQMRIRQRVKTRPRICLVVCGSRAGARGAGDGS